MSRKQLEFEERERKRVARIEKLEKLFPSVDIPVIQDQFGCSQNTQDLGKECHFQYDNPHMKNALNVPVRYKGLTSSGIQLMCHWNVINLVYHYGGYRLGGYCVQRCPDLGITFFQHHSVWVTPENRAVCVTSENYGADMNMSGTTSGMYPKDIIFVPLVKEKRYTVSFSSFYSHKDGTFYFHEVPDTEDVITRHGRNAELIKDNLATLKKLDRDYTVLSQRYFRFSLLYFQRQNSDTQYKQDLLAGGFSLPSIYTGKTWDEIQDEFMKDFPNPIYPNPIGRQGNKRKKSS
mgnify:CR=1 FL=1